MCHCSARKVRLAALASDIRFRSGLHVPIIKSSFLQCFGKKQSPPSVGRQRRLVRLVSSCWRTGLRHYLGRKNDRIRPRFG
jgi:hypothetical protein